MIKAHCKTNIDSAKIEIWPQWFVDVPRIGDRVRADSGKALTVCRVTHCYKKHKSYEGGSSDYPYIEIELTDARHGALNGTF